MIHVNSKVCAEAAETIRATPEGVMPLTNGWVASAAQFDTMARLLREAEPSVITSATGPAKVTLNEPQERPGYIRDWHTDHDPEVIVFDVGILGSTHRIARDGSEVEHVAVSTSKGGPER